MSTPAPEPTLPDLTDVDLTTTAQWVVSLLADPELANTSGRTALATWGILLGMTNEDALAHAHRLAAEPRTTVRAYLNPF